MGEAVYTLVAGWITPISQETTDELNALGKQLSDANDWWQEHRGQAPEVFWPAFNEAFPLIVPMLQQEPNLVGGDCNNTLAGELSYPNTRFDGLYDVGDDQLVVQGEVWHFADWDRLERLLRDKYHADAVAWESDEYTEPGASSFMAVEAALRWAWR